MNPISNLFKAMTLPSVKTEDPSESSLGNNFTERPDLSRRPTEAGATIANSTEDEEENYDKDEEEEQDGFTHIEKRSVGITSRNPARRVLRRSETLTQLKRPSAPQPHRPNPPLPKDYLLPKEYNEDHPTYYKDGFVEEAEQDDSDNYLSVEKISVEVVQRNPVSSAARPVLPNTVPPHPKPSPPHRPKTPSPAKANSKSPRKTPSTPRIIRGTQDISSPSGGGKKLSRPRPATSLSPASPKNRGKRPTSPHRVLTPLKRISPPKLQPLYEVSHDIQDVTSFPHPAAKQKAKSTNRRLPRPVTISTPSPLPPTNTASLSSSRHGPKVSPNALGSPITPPPEDVLFSARVTRSQTARVRTANNGNVHVKPRRVGLMALTYQGREELPVYQDANGGASKRVIFKPVPGRYRGQGIWKNASRKSPR